MGIYGLATICQSSHFLLKAAIEASLELNKVIFSKCSAERWWLWTFPGYYVWNFVDQTKAKNSPWNCVISVPGVAMIGY